MIIKEKSEEHENENQDATPLEDTEDTLVDDVDEIYENLKSIQHCKPLLEIKTMTGQCVALDQEIMKIQYSDDIQLYRQEINLRHQLDKTLMQRDYLMVRFIVLIFFLFLLFPSYFLIHF